MSDIQQHSQPEAQDLLDSQLTRALTAVPRVQVPADFSLRVMQQLPARPAIRSLASLPAIRATYIGRRAAFAAVAILFVAMLAAALRAATPGHPASVILTWTLTAEFIVLTVWLTLWLTLRPQPLR